MDNNYGVKISAPGTNVKFGSVNDITFNTKYPFLKIDTQLPTGFQSINLSIINDPPEPDGFIDVDKYTVIYQFKHGYSYTPSLETLFYVVSPFPGVPYYQQYFLDSGILSAHTAFDGASIYAVADNTNVYFIVWKYYEPGLGGQQNPLSGILLRISCHVFVDDLSGA